MKNNKILNEMYSGMMCGISHMIPVIIVGAIVMSLPNFWLPGQVTEATSGVAYYMYTWGSTLFGMMYYVLAIYTAYGIADRPAIVSGLIAGIITMKYEAGFLGAVIGGLIAGYITRYIMKFLKLPAFMGPAKGIFFVPMISGLSIMVIMEFAVGPSCAFLMDLLYKSILWVESIGSKAILIGVQGAMYNFGMGGPFCYGVYPLELSLVAIGDYSMTTAGLLAASASCLGIVLSIILFPKKFTPDERAGIPGLLTGWVCCITEFQIPYFIKDIKTFTPCFLITGFIGAYLCAITGCIAPAVHGGLFILPLNNHPFIYMGIHMLQAVLTCGYIFLAKKDLSAEEHGYLEEGNRKFSLKKLGILKKENL